MAPFYETYERIFKENFTSDPTVLLMQVGKFYEVLAADPESMSILDRVAGLLELRKECPEEMSRRRPAYIGFPETNLSKFLPVLMASGWRVIVARQQDTGKMNDYVVQVYMT